MNVAVKILPEDFVKAVAALRVPGWCRRSEICVLSQALIRLGFQEVESGHKWVSASFGGTRYRFHVPSEGQEMIDRFDALTDRVSAEGFPDFEFWDVPEFVLEEV